jgi:hypothetical protein
MKTLKISILLFSLIFSSSIKAQDSAYFKVMQKALKMMEEDESIEDRQKTANLFDRIAEKENEEWLPLYYSGLNYIYMSFGDSLDLNQRDAYLAKAKERVEKAANISEENAEIIVLIGYVDMARLAADPASRGASLSAQIMQTFAKAVAMAPNNPRALLMLARMELGMAQFFGSGTEKACDLASQSMEVYKLENKKGIEPKWGQGMAKQMLISCEKKDKN